MIDIKEKTIFKLTPLEVDKILDPIHKLLLDGKKVLSAFIAVRNQLKFIAKRPMATNVQGFTGHAVVDPRLCRRVVLAAFTSVVLVISPSSNAGQADNILGCVKKAKEYSGITLNEFDASYVGNVLSPSEVRWSNAYCEAKVGAIYTLTVNGKNYIYKGYSGKESYDLYNSLEGKTEKAIGQLESRIALLKERLSSVDAELSKPRPDHRKLTSYIDDGISGALGSAVAASNRSTLPASVPPASVQAKVAERTITTPDKAVAKSSTPAVNNSGSSIVPAVSQKKAVAATSHDRDSAIRLEMMSTGKAAVKSRLKDPGSADFKDVRVQKRDDMWVTCGEVNSKNAYGGYVGFQKFVSAGSSDSTFLEQEVQDFATVWNRLCR